MLYVITLLSFFVKKHYNQISSLAFLSPLSFIDSYGDAVQNASTLRRVIERTF